MIGTTLSHYRILEELGRGGMGIVYKAEDTKLERTVAIKVLPAAALSNEEERARFYREAKAAAALNHPHIAAVHEIDEAIAVDTEGNKIEASDGPRPFIAMEYIEGGTLEDRIKKRPLKLDEAARIAAQVADALKAAHAKEIVHRDIKSANIMLNQDGQAKVMDFGLAQTSASTKLTRMGSTLGTVAYMSPEQARGEEVDGRTDLYSLGTVLYEMISGQLPFGGEYEQAIVYSILNADPEPLTALRTGVPMELERITNKLLAKNIGVRYQSAADLIADLNGLNIQVSSQSHADLRHSTIQPVAAAPGQKGVPVWAVIAAFLSGAALIGAAYSMFSPKPERDSQVHRFEVVLPTPEPVSDLSISADGSTIAYMGSSPGEDFVYIYDMATGLSRPLEVTNGAQVVELSEDGSSILITTAIGINRSSTRVSSPIDVLSSSEGTPRANWGPDGTILYEDEARVYVYSPETGDRRRFELTDTTDVIDVDWPSLLPDGHTVMATIEYRGSRRGLVFWEFETGEERARLAQGGYRARYVPSGHIIMVIGASTEAGNVVALPFDINSLEQVGPIVPIATGVTAEQMAVSQTGTLIYRLGGGTGFGLESDLLFLAMDGTTVPLDFPPARYNSIKVNDEGDKAVVSITDGLSTSRLGDALDTYVLNLGTGEKTQLTFGTQGGAADWYLGSDSVMYVDNSQRIQGHVRVMVRAANGSGDAREAFRSTTGIHDIDISQDGSKVIYTTGLSSNGATELEIRVIETGEVIPLSDGRAAQRRRPTFSPDDSLVSYQEDGRLLIRASDGTGLAASADGGGGRFPVWDAVSGLMFTYGPISMAIWSGLGTPNQDAVSTPGRVMGMDALPGGSLLLVAIEGSDETSATDEQTAADSTRTIMVTLNLFEELK